MGRRELVLSVGAACLASLAGCAPGEEGFLSTRAPRDVVLITVDTLRWDGPGFSGSGRASTPTLDRLAESGIVFETAHAHAVVTLPSHASILTGLLPYQHGARDNGGFTLRGDVPTLATILREKGYATAAFVSAFPLDRRFGLDRGFEVYDDEYGGSGATFELAERKGDETIARARAWWDSKAGGRRFLWVHLFTPHFPYEPPEPHLSRHPAAPYWGEVEATDAELGPLLLPILEEKGPAPLVVVTSDHGEALGDHGEETHGLFAYESTLRVPLLFHAPGALRPARIAAPAGHVDLLPTVLDLLGIEPPGGLPGRSLFARGGPSAGGSYFEALSASFNRGWAPLRGRIEGGMKAIDLPIPELYDLAADPGETRNLAAERASFFHEVVGRIPEEARAAPDRGGLDPEVLARLRSLGYVTAAGPSDPPFEPGNDPKTLVATEHAIDAALGAWRDGRIEEALGSLRGLVRDHPRLAVASSHLASMLLDLGRSDEAARVLEEALGREAATEDMTGKLALALDLAGHPERAAAVLEPFSDSRDPATQSAIGRVAASLGRTDEARRRFERALALDPTYPQGYVDLGTLRLSQGDLEGAARDLDRAVAADPSLAEGWNALGVVRMRRGDEGGAAEAWERAVAADPRLPDPLFNLAVARARRGEYDRAESALRRYVELVRGEERSKAEAMLAQLVRERKGRR